MDASDEAFHGYGLYAEAEDSSRRYVRWSARDVKEQLIPVSVAVVAVVAVVGLFSIEGAIFFAALGSALLAWRALVLWWAIRRYDKALAEVRANPAAVAVELLADQLAFREQHPSYQSWYFVWDDENGRVQRALYMAEAA